MKNEVPSAPGRWGQGVLGPCTEPQGFEAERKKARDRPSSSLAPTRFQGLKVSTKRDLLSQPPNKKDALQSKRIGTGGGVGGEQQGGGGPIRSGKGCFLKKGGTTGGGGGGGTTRGEGEKEAGGGGSGGLSTTRERKGGKGLLSQDRGTTRERGGGGSAGGREQQPTPTPLSQRVVCHGSKLGPRRPLR